MDIIEPKRADVENPRQIKKYSAPLRLWHWLNALVISGSLLTVLVNSTILEGKDNTVYVKSQLAKADAVVTDKQARAVAHGLSDKVWQWHIYFGYCLAGLFVLRLLLEIFQLADQKLLSKIKTAYRKLFIVKKDMELARHELFVKTLYSVFYLMLLTMVSTGLCLAFEDDVPALKAIKAIRQVHGFTMYLVIAFIIVHLAGVFLAERKDSKGIVSDMINGGAEGEG